MADIWYCTRCGYEVRKRGKCHNCKEPLTASPIKELAEGEVEDEVGYSLEEWEDAARGELIGALASRGLRHRFDGDELVVAAADEETVDQLVDELSAPEEADEETEERDAGATEVLAALSDAAGRLRVDPTDMIADGDLAEAAGRMFALDDPPGVEAETWAAVGRVTRRLLGALGADEALEDEIAESSQLLCRLLEEFADPGAAAGGESTTPAAAKPGSGTDLARAGAAERGVERGAGEEFLEDLDPLRRPLLTDDLAPGDGTLGRGPRGGADAPAGADAAEEDDDQEEMVYELEDWMPEERAQITLLLEQENIAHIWEGLDLVVAAVHDERVEALMAKVDRVPNDESGPSEAGDDEARYHVISNLFGAADRLAGDGENEQRQQDLVDAAALIQDWSTPFAMTDDDWWKIRLRARGLSESITTEASGPVIEDGAASLRDLLRKFV